MSEVKITAIDKVYRFIYLLSLTIIGIGLFSFIIGLYFLDNYNAYPRLERIFELLALVTPFAPIGTLFGTLKEGQTSHKKLTILFLTGLGVVLLLLFIWGSLLAVSFT